MDKEFYRAMLAFVNDKKQMSLLLEYTLAKIDVLHQQLETTKDHSRVLEIQGSIQELRRFRTLRDEVLAGAK
tara:strand:- start:729 stop:944 length:216 start_codon:yes stop_codon:yes gene_type:complete